jgi:hypothetical protein
MKEARITTGQSQARQKTNFDTKLFTNRFNERDWVWVANPEKGPEHPHRWYGPYIVQKVTNQGKCLKVSPGPQIHGIPRPTGIHPVVSIDRAKPFYYSEPRREAENHQDDDLADEHSSQTRAVPLEHTTREHAALGHTTPDRPCIEFIPLGTDNIRPGPRLGEVIFAEAPDVTTGNPVESPKSNPQGQSSPNADTAVPTSPPDSHPSSNEGEEAGRDETQSTITEPMEESRNKSITTEPAVEPESPEAVQEEAEGFETDEEDEPEPERTEKIEQPVLRRSQRTIRKPARYAD